MSKRSNVFIDARLYERVRKYALREGLTPEEVFCESAAACLRHIECGKALSRDTTAVRAFCEANGWTDYRVFPGGRDACVARCAFVCAILADLTIDGYGNVWCYPTVEHARDALAAWDGARESEPQGWYAHPASGRKRPGGDATREYRGR